MDSDDGKTFRRTGKNPFRMWGLKFMGLFSQTVFTLLNLAPLRGHGSLGEFKKMVCSRARETLK